MTQDWKEALAALRGDADAGVTDNPANDTDAAPAVPTDGGEILLQGDRRQQAAALLRDMGYKLKGGC